MGAFQWGLLTPGNPALDTSNQRPGEGVAVPPFTGLLGQA